MAYAVQEAFLEWRRADMAARVAETQLRAAREVHEKDGGPVPLTDLLVEASRLRSTANETLTVALLAIDQASVGTRQPPGTAGV